MYNNHRIRYINFLSEIIDRYTVWFIDINGIVHDGVDPFPKAVKSLRKLQETSQVIFLSNMPRPNTLVRNKLVGIGLHDHTLVFTSGDAVRRDLLSKYADQKIFHLGASRNTDILKELDVQTVENLADADIVLLSLFIEHDENIEQYDALLKEIVDSEKPVLCANPDLTAQSGQTIRYCAGTFAQRIKQMGGNVIYYGKPNSSIYESAHTLFCPNTDLNKMIMVGDTLETDILGANNFGIDSLLVLTGNTGDDIKATGQETDRYLQLCIQKNPQLQPTYVVSDLKMPH